VRRRKQISTASDRIFWKWQILRKSVTQQKRHGDEGSKQKNRLWQRKKQRRREAETVTERRKVASNGTDPSDKATKRREQKTRWGWQSEKDRNKEAETYVQQERQAVVACCF